MVLKTRARDIIQAERNKRREGGVIWVSFLGNSEARAPCLDVRVFLERGEFCPIITHGASPPHFWGKYEFYD